MLKRKNAILKIGILCIMFFFALSIVVLGDKVNLSTVKVQFANGSEINIFTTKSKISDILADANIILLETEVVSPNLEENLDETKKIIISDINNAVEISDETSTEITNETLKNEYGTITEKIITVEEEIPFETIEKNVSSKVKGVKTTNKVLQKGVNGLKEVTYKCKYRNSVEISKEEISSKIIKEPVNKIVQIVVQSTTSRNTSARVDGGVTLAAKVAGMTPKELTMNVSAYTASTCDKLPTDPGYGITASGARVTEWYTVAAGSGYKMGTVIYIPYFKDKPNGGWFVVQDRGGAISNTKLDIYMDTYNQCIQFGRKNLTCYVYEF